MTAVIADSASNFLLANFCWQLSAALCWSACHHFLLFRSHCHTSYDALGLNSVSKIDGQGSQFLYFDCFKSCIAGRRNQVSKPASF
ncbi:hypothetical protein VTN96DRAFT_7286 [Rasamsonia emersonii]